MATIVVGLVWMAMVAQRRDYQRTSDAGFSRAIEEIRHEVRSLRAADADTKATQQQIRRDVQEVKEAVQQ